MRSNFATNSVSSINYDPTEPGISDVLKKELSRLTDGK